MIVRAAPEQRRAHEWALALASADIPCHVHLHEGGWVLDVTAGDAARAISTLEAYDRENAGAPPRMAAPLDYGRSYGGLVTAMLLLAFYPITRMPDSHIAWFRMGSAAAGRILDGELWRTVTALTLHANLPHVAGNAVFCALFGTALCRAVGPGVGVWLMLLSGAGGNALDALLRGPGYSSVGASTAVLGAVGSLGAVQVVNRSRQGTALWRAWVPLAAALGLLAMVGTDKESDFLAHGFGFVVGAGVGSIAALGLRRPPARDAQLLLGLAALGTVIGCWLVALA